MSKSKNCSVIDVNSPLLKTASEKIAPAVKLELASLLELDDKKSVAFAEELVTLVKSKDFIQELNGVIGNPTDFKSENEYVDNAKEQMRKLLKSKLV